MPHKYLTKFFVKLGTIGIIRLNTEGLHIVHVIKYGVPRETSIVFHNGSNYDHFIVKVIAKKSEVEFNFLGKST